MGHIQGRSTLQTTSSGTATIFSTRGDYRFKVHKGIISVGDLMDRGDCESTTPPMIYGETAPIQSGATVARSAAQAYEGSYSYIFTKTVVAGSNAITTITQAPFTATSMHGLSPGTDVTVKCQIYVPSGGMTGTEGRISIWWWPGAGAAQNIFANTYDAWQPVSATGTLPAGATGVSIGFEVANTAALNETFYMDNIEIHGTLSAEFTEVTAGGTTGANLFNIPLQRQGKLYTVDFGSEGLKASAPGSRFVWSLSGSAERVDAVFVGEDF